MKWYVSAVLIKSPNLQSPRKVKVVLAIQRSGSITGTQVVESVGDLELDQAAVRGINSASPLPPLPSEFSTDYLSLRLQFTYLPGKPSESVSDGKSVIKTTAADEPDETSLADSIQGEIAQGLVYRLPYRGKTTPPRVIYGPDPHYTDRALRAKIEGSVLISLTVTAAGEVGEATVTNGLDKDLEKEALAAVSTWRFQPATQDGKPVAKRIDVTITFHVYDPPK